jgi:tetratricopeptide (TPR) repeat protein
MKKIIILIFILCSTLVSLGQNDYKSYYEVRNQAMDLHALGKYQEATKFYEKAFSLAYPFPDDMKFLYQCYLQMNKADMAYKVLQQMVMCGYKLCPDTLPIVGYDLSAWCERDSTIINNKRFLSEYDSLRLEYLKNIDVKANNYLIANSICEYFVAILRFRGSDSIENEILNNKPFLLKTELLNSLLKSDKNIDRKHTDHWLDTRFLLSLIHSVQSLKEKSPQLDLLWEHVLRGNILAEQYAFFYDNAIYQNDMNSGGIGVSLLGFQTILKVYKDDKGNEVEEYKVVLKDPENVDKYRKEKLLPPLWVWCKLNNIALPENYKY